MKRAFVLMPFSEPFDSYYVNVFKPAFENNGYIPKRADDMFAPRPIMNDVRRGIAEADLILCELTGRNPNVFYELGMSHAVGKHVILVTQKMKDIPIDLKHLRTLVYDTKKTNWAMDLASRIEKSIVEIEQSNLPPDPPSLFPMLNTIINHKSVSLVRTRADTIRILASIANAAKAGELLFGSCNLCTDYPNEFYEGIKRAAERKVRMCFIARSHHDSNRFLRFMTGIREEFGLGIKVYVSTDSHIRAFGLENSRVIVAIPLDEIFLGLYLRDELFAAHFKRAFDFNLLQAEEINYSSFGPEEEEDLQ